jgi:thymidylate synthase ThyX
MTSDEVVRWADRAQYHSAQMPAETRAPGGGTRPTVRLLNATPDPLGGLAALCGIYEGKVYSSLRAVDDDERRAAWEAMRSTVLNGPLESIVFHFLVQGVTRAFTHQAVRNRFSFFAQESMRFAVVDDERWIDRQAYPPSLASAPVSTSEVAERVAAYEVGDNFERPDFMTPEERDYALRRDAWDDAILTAEAAYRRLVDAGVPAEEARGLMPHSITTRYHWVVSIRTLLGEAGKRLCTQAQFEWRVVMAEVVKALRDYAIKPDTVRSECVGGQWKEVPARRSDAWQFELMAEALQPICYQEGRCGFMAKFDRGCTIRGRVDRFAANNVSSQHWGSTGQYDVAAGQVSNVSLFNDGSDLAVSNIAEFRPLLPIHPKEWLADPAAARVAPGDNNE